MMSPSDIELQLARLRQDALVRDARDSRRTWAWMVGAAANAVARRGRSSVAAGSVRGGTRHAGAA